MRSVRGWVFILLIFSLISRVGFSDTPPFLPNSTLTLQDVVAVALLHHPDIQAREGTLKAGMGRADQLHSDYYPQIGFDSSYNRGNYLGFTGPTSEIVSQQVFTEYYSAFSTNWILEDWGKRHAEVEEGNGWIGMGKALLAEARNDVIFNAADAYFKVLQAGKLTEVNRKLEEASRKRMEQAAGFVKAGEKPKLEFLNAQAAYLSDHFNALKAQEDLENAKAHLNSTMGISNPPPYSVKTDLSVPPYTVELAQAKALAFQRNPTLLWHKWDVARQRALVNELKAQRWPVVSANGSYGWADPTFPPGTQAWTLGVGLHWPIFDGNKLTHQINETEGDLKEADNQEKSFRLKTEEDIEKNYLSYQSTRERLDVANQELTDAEEASRLADARYKVGLATFVEVTDAQARLAQANFHQVQAITDLRISLSSLKHSIGLEEP